MISVAVIFFIIFFPQVIYSNNTRKKKKKKKVGLVLGRAGFLCCYFPLVLAHCSFSHSVCYSVKGLLLLSEFEVLIKVGEKIKSSLVSEKLCRAAQYEFQSHACPFHRLL